MDQALLEQLQAITPEEQRFLAGSKTIDRDLYMLGLDNTINAEKLLAEGKRITARPNTRFIDFPTHTHDYVEMVYMCTGTTVHTVNGKRITMHSGELLLLGQSAHHAVCKAGLYDVGVNFIVLPDFFATTLSALGQEKTPLHRFLTDCLCMQNTGPGYLHFAVSHVKSIQNLVENLLFTLLQNGPNRRKTSEMTMALLFLQLTEQTQTLQHATKEDSVVLRALQYIENHYKDGSFQQLCQRLHYDPSWLSRQIKRGTGKTYSQLVRQQRLAQAAFLLKNTDRNVADISLAVGYENISFFHKIFTQDYGMSPKHYRDNF